jgi:hypothetical protein
MASTDVTVAIDLDRVDTAAAFDQNVFPLAYYEYGGDNQPQQGQPSDQSNTTGDGQD